MKLRDDPRAFAIMGCAMRVHRTLGPGFLESAYGDALEIEFAKTGIPYVREDEVRVVYDGQPLKTTYRADFTCYDRSYIVELKAIRSLSKIEWAQVIHYMRATKIRFALLVNFGRAQFQYETFDLENIPTASVVDSLPSAYPPAVDTPVATACADKTSLPQTVEGECLARSPDHSAER